MAVSSWYHASWNTAFRPQLKKMLKSSLGCLQWHWPLLDLIKVFYKSVSCRTCANKMHWLCLFLFPLALHLIFLAHWSNLLSLKDKLWEISQGNWTVMVKTAYTDDGKKEKGMKFYIFLHCLSLWTPNPTQTSLLNYFCYLGWGPASPRIT